MSDSWSKLKEVENLPENNKDVVLICKILKSLPEQFSLFTSSWRLVNEENRSIENLTQKLRTFENNLSKDVSQEVLHVKTGSTVHKIKQTDYEKKQYSKKV